MDRKTEGFAIRFAEEKDVGLILKFIKGIAEYEKMLPEVVATEELLREWVFKKQSARVIIGELRGVPVGFSLFFHNFSTFMGRAGLYIEDIFVWPEYRGKGFGKALFLYLAKLAHEEGCGRMEWCCLDWNQPSIDFYRSMGARSMDGWSTYRLTKEQLRELSE
ncbi:GNAT family N-acetyltransferase [Fumia xinanensis]|uniref:GNAT family N-acetyltransferase n=1 Tax=Fumia xinanensis TaxID=2763659 RepID=A0A926E2V3_9FIRM|nr:GNAT family N-acetyltransferase [Fumia xinanensis]MBC8560037.1 GNAT family N-acetyltransferase [Fumia xinanensis]